VAAVLAVQKHLRERALENVPRPFHVAAHAIRSGLGKDIRLVARIARAVCARIARDLLMRRTVERFYADRAHGGRLRGRHVSVGIYK
jgi:hypothetical protein